MITLTDNCKKVLKYMQEKSKDNQNIFIGKEMSEKLNIYGIYPCLETLIRKKLIINFIPALLPFTNYRGEIKMKEYKTYSLTEKGKKFTIK